jgi:DNA-binding HxlR family transcriptional regulator
VETPSHTTRAPRTDGRPKAVCPDFHEAIELIGRRWTGAIVWALAAEPLYFADLCASIPGLSDRLLSTRLRELEAEGLVARSVHSGAPARVSYALTEKGRALEPAMRELREWAREWKAEGPA